MGGKQLIEQFLKDISRVSPGLADSYLHHRGSIGDEDGQTVLEDVLRRYGLVTSLNPEEGARMAPQLTRLLDHIVKPSHRQRGGHGVAQAWEELEGNYVLYLQAGLSQDREHLRDEIWSSAHFLMEEVNAAIHFYSRFIERGYANVKSLDIRLQQNERVLSRASDLNMLMENCDLAQFREHSTVDQELRKLFYLTLPNAFGAARKELRSALANLQQLIAKIREEQGLSSLLHSLQNHLESNPEFVPSVPTMVNGVPVPFNVAGDLSTHAVPNIYREQHRDTMAAWLKGLRQGMPDVGPEEPQQVGELSDVRNAVAEQLPPDHMYDAAEGAVHHVLHTGDAISALELYELLELEESFEIWGFALMNTIIALPEMDKAALSVDYVSDVDDFFSGNQLVADVIVKKVA